MEQLNIKPEDKPIISKGRYTQLHPWVMQKYDALHLKDCGLSNRQICLILGICNNTLLSFFKQYTEGGLTRLNEINFNQPESDLKAHSVAIEKYLEENPPQAIHEAAAEIESLTGIKRGETQVRKFLKDKGFRFRRVGTVPAKALTEEKNEQGNFLEQELAPRVEEAKAGKRVVYFADAVHFVYGVFVACLWSLKRVFTPTPFGRNRYNVLGAIDAISHDLVTVCNTTYINALSVCDLLEPIALQHLKESIPVTIVLDNARYQRCNYYVMEKAKSSGIELLFLPSTVPN